MRLIGLVMSLKKLVVQLNFVEFPPTYTCDGQDLSPEIRIIGVEAVTIAIIALNPFEPGCSFCNWLIWNLPPLEFIPPGIAKVLKVASPIEAVQGRNDYGNIGYNGPCPPVGETHRITFKIYGLDSVLHLDPGEKMHDLINAMKGHVLQFGSTTAMYHR
jgi:Raf kinase inhibitor-like YbhB/YbcL family protein